MLMMVEKRTRGRICHAIQRYGKANNKCMKNYGKNIESSYFMQMQAICMDGHVSKIDCNVSKFNEEFIKNCDENSDKGYIPEADTEYPKNLLNLHSD